MSKQVAAVLDLGHDLLERDGWRRGIGRKWAKTGRERCALVAIAEADLQLRGKHGGILFVDAADALRAVVGEPVTVWNDADGRRVTEVLAAFKVAAGRERDAA